MESYLEDEFEEAARKPVKRLANQDGGAIEKAHPREDFLGEKLAISDRLVAKLELISAVSNILLTEFDDKSLPGKFGFITEKAAEILEAELCSLWLVKGGQISLETSCSQKGKVEAKKRVVLAIRDGDRTGMTGSIAFHKKIFNAYGKALENYPARNPNNPANFVPSQKVFSELAYPMLDDNQNLIGLLFAYNKKDVNGQPLKNAGFSNELDEPLMRILTANIVISMKNVRLMTRLRALMKKLKNYEAILAAAAIEKTVASFTHDIKNFSSMIAGETQWLKKLEREDQLHFEEIKKAIRNIDSYVKKIDDFTNDLQSRAYKHPPELSRLNLRDVIKEATHLIAAKASHHAVEIQKDERSFDVQLYADYEQLSKVFFNIMTNAMDAMPDGGILRIRAKIDGRHVRISFSDTGTGIPEKHLGKVLHPFFTTKKQGHGLGLAITKRIVESEHRGKLVLHSKQGQGTSVEVLLPLDLK